MATVTFKRMGSTEESRSSVDQGDEIYTSKISNLMGISRNSKGFYKLAIVCLGLLCVILLMILIISHKSHNSDSNNDPSDGGFQAQTSDNSTHEVARIQTHFSKLTEQMDLLLTGHNTLIQEKHLLLTRYNNLTDDRNLLQISYNKLILEKAQLSDKYNNLTTEKEILQINYNNLNTEKSKLQTTYNNLISENSQLSDEYNDLTQEKEYLQTNYNDLTEEKSKLQTNYTNLLLEKSQLSDKYNNLTKENEYLQTNYNNLDIEKSNVQARYDNLTKEMDEQQRPQTKLASRLAEGWIAAGSSLYKVSTERKSWLESRKSCQNMGADLVIVNNEDEQTLLLPYKMTWIGLSDHDHEGAWRWVDDTPITIQYWVPGEPNNAGNEDCAEIGSEASQAKKAWNDAPCSNKLKYICEEQI